LGCSLIIILKGASENFGFWLLAFGFWLLAFGFWLLAFGFWLLAFGFWLLARTFRRVCPYFIASAGRRAFT
jgi:hypothetical protein